MAFCFIVTINPLLWFHLLYGDAHWRRVNAFPFWYLAYKPHNWVFSYPGHAQKEWCPTRCPSYCARSIPFTYMWCPVCARARRVSLIPPPTIPITFCLLCSARSAHVHGTWDVISPTAYNAHNPRFQASWCEYIMISITCQDLTHQ